MKNRLQEETSNFGDEYPAAPAAWTAVAVLLLLYALAFVDRQVVSLLVGDLKANFGVSDFQISLLQGFAFALFYALLGLPFGMAADKLPRRNVICFGVLVWAIAATCCGLAQTFPQLLAARMLVGAGEAALAPAAYSILSEMFPKRKLTLVLSVYAIGALLGAELSLAIGALLVHFAEGGVVLPIVGEVPAWRFAFLVTGAPGVLLAFTIYLIPEPVRRTTPGKAASTWADVFRFMKGRWGFFAAHFIGFSCFMGLAYARLSWNPAFLSRRFDWPIDKIGLFLATFHFLAGVAAFLTTGTLVDKLVARGVKDAHFRFYVVGSAVIVVAGPLSFLAPAEWMFFVGMTICTIWVSLAGIAASSVQYVTPPELRGRVSAIYLAVIALIGMTVGPSMVGLLTDNVFGDPKDLHYSLAITYAVLSAIAVAAFSLGLKPMQRAAELVDARTSALPEGNPPERPQT